SVAVQTVAGRRGLGSVATGEAVLVADGAEDRQADRSLDRFRRADGRPAEVTHKPRRKGGGAGPKQPQQQDQRLAVLALGRRYGTLDDAHIGRLPLVQVLQYPRLFRAAGIGLVLLLEDVAFQ